VVLLDIGLRGIVCRLIRLVNGYWDVHIKYYIHDFYNKWENSEEERSRRTYYNVRQQRVLDLNGDISVYTMPGRVTSQKKKLSEACWDTINSTLVHYEQPLLPHHSLRRGRTMVWQQGLLVMDKCTVDRVPTCFTELLLL
jgi:hypothetical protein